ncbi:MAG: hypothetical protein EOP52_02435 [Sphingobacteriales bacterium]|nr:MAG: hypothetical protein EOP52_02435 [Sphingobacteriales bacterium]
MGSYVDSFYQHQISTFIIKYTPTGSIIWRKDFTGYGIREVFANNLEIDSSDRLYVAGNYGFFTTPNPPVTDANLLIDTTVSSDPTELGQYNGFLFSLDTSGKRLWSRFFTGNNQGASIGALSVNKAGQIALTGSYIDTFQIDTFRVTQPMVDGGATAAFFCCSFGCDWQSTNASWRSWKPFTRLLLYKRQTGHLSGWTILRSNSV